MLLCQKTFSFVMWKQQSGQDSQPHMSWLAGIARKISCFALRLAYVLFQKCFRDPIDFLAATIHLSMS